MNELLTFLQDHPGPWAIGLATGDEKQELTAGSFYAECSKFELSENGDIIAFYTPDEKDGHHISEILIVIDSLEMVSITNEMAVFLNHNFTVTVKDFLPEMLFYVQPLQSTP